MQRFVFDAIIQKVEDQDAAYILVPFDIRQVYGKGRVRVHAAFDGVGYDGSIVNMGVRNESGQICYLIGVLKSIRARLGKADGDVLRVTVTER